jgi:hypothetical protein
MKSGPRDAVPTEALTVGVGERSRGVAKSRPPRGPDAAAQLHALSMGRQSRDCHPAVGSRHVVVRHIPRQSALGPSYTTSPLPAGPPRRTR